MENKTIAFIHESFPFGGAEAVTSHISKYLISKGYTVYVFAFNINESILMANHAEVLFVKLPNRDINSKENADFIINKADEFSLSFLLSNDLTVNLNYIRNESRCKVIFTNHSMPLWELVIKFSMTKEYKKVSFGKIIEWYLLRLPRYKLFNSAYKKVRKKYANIYNSVDGYTVLCDEYGQKIAKIVGVEYDTSKIYPLINPTIDLLESINLQKKKQVIFTGRLNYLDKRVDRLLAIWNLVYHNFPDWELLIVGEGKEEENLKKLAIELNLKNYKFCGYSKNIGEYLQNASILCLTSSYEGWPLSLTEAQRYGVVPIAFNCCDGIETILSPCGENGVLVESFDLKKYAEELSELMSNEKLREKIQANIIEKAKEYSLENVGRAWEIMFDKLNDKK